MVSSASEHLQSPLDLDFVELLFDAFIFAHAFKKDSGAFPGPADLVQRFNQGAKVSHFKESICQTFSDFPECFGGPKPEEMTKRQRDALQLRWGFSDGERHSLSDVSKDRALRLSELVILERSLLS